MCNYVQHNVQFSYHTDILSLSSVTGGVIHATETHMVAEKNVLCYLILTTLEGIEAGGSHISVHQNYQEVLVKQIAGIHPQSF